MPETSRLTARRVGALAAAAMLAGFGAVAIPTAATAATFEVSTTAELIAAIDDANAAPGLDTIRLAAGTYVLAASLPAFTDDVEVIGAGPAQTIIDANGAFGFYNDPTAGSIAMRFEGFAVSNASIGAISITQAEGTVRNLVLDGTGIDISLPDDGGTAIVEDVTVTDSSDHGVNIRGALDSDIQVRRVTVQDGDQAGLYVTAFDTTTVTVDDIIATGNALQGIYVTADNGQATLSRLTASTNGDDGMRLEARVSATVTVSSVDAVDNGGDGLDVDASGTSRVDIADVRVSGSGDNGIEAEAQGADATVTVSGATSAGNTNSGIVVGSDGEGGRVDIADSTFTGNGAPTGSSNACGVAVVDDSGTGVRATLVRSTVADSPAVLGGVCLIFDGATGGSLDIADITVTGNTTFMAAVYLNTPLGTTTDIVNSTITDNGAIVGTFLGGGLLAGGLVASGEVTVRSTTIADNSAGNFNVLFAGLTQATVSDSILSGHPTADLFVESMADPQIDTTLVQTVDDSASPAVEAGTGNITGADPLLLPLAANGGPTLTRLPDAGSPVIDAGNPAYAGPSTDQRGTGFPRILGTRVDLGAIEAVPTLPQTGIDSGGAILLAASGLLLGMLGLGLTLVARRRSNG